MTEVETKTAQSGEPEQEKPSGKVISMLKPGYAWNPLCKLPRNKACPCGSKKKFKHCHLPDMPRAIPQKIADQYKAALASVDHLEFVDDPKAPAVEIKNL